MPKIAATTETLHTKYVGMSVNVIPSEHDEFHEFQGTCIGIRNGNLQVADQDDDTWEVNPSQVTFANADEV